MDKTLNRQFNGLIQKSLIIGLFVLITTYVAIYSYVIGSKKEIAQLLVGSIRNDLITLQLRSAINTLSLSKNYSFEEIYYSPKMGNSPFVLYTRDVPTHHYVSRVISVPLHDLFGNESGATGEVFFVVNLNRMVFLFVLFTFFVVIGVFVLIAFGKKRLRKQLDYEIQVHENRLKLELATQVAHDIRSPLATIDMITSGSEGVENNFELLKSAAKRIHGIADDLLDRNRVSTEETQPLKKINLSSTLQSIIDEKKIQIAHHELTLELHSKDVLINANEVELFRIISNLINNSIEASEKSKPITIVLKKESDQAVIQIADKGKGIPKELLERLGERGVTQGKEKGNGLGIFHAKKTIESWGGELQVISAVGEGTTISLILPIVCSNKKHIVLLDDDDLLRLTWESKARSENIEITTFSHPDDLLKAIPGLPENAVYYIDSCLSDDVKGEDVALQLSKLGVSDIYLATGFEADKFGDLDHIKGIVGKDFPEYLPKFGVGHDSN